MVKVLKNLLSAYGYNLVALPKTDIEPLQLLYKLDNGLGAVNSSLYTLFPESDMAPPEILPDGSTSDIMGSASMTYDAQAGINVLEWLLKKLNMGKASGKVEVNGNDDVTIAFESVIESKVDLLALDNYISNSQPSTEKFNAFRKKLEHSELYVISAVLKSNAFTLTVNDKNGQKVDVAASVKGVVDATVDFSHNSDNSITLKNPGQEPVIFAFKAQQIIYDQKKWWQLFKKNEISFTIKDQQGEVLRDESDYPTRPLLLNDEPADI